MLDYVLDFSRNYKNVSRFSYVHLNTAHEGSGTVISSLDEDLKDFLEEFWNLDGDNVIFLMGDHGMRYGSWFTQIDGSHEHRLPLLMISASDGVRDRFQNFDFFLRYNTKRLVSKFDLHLSLKALASGEPYNPSLICSTSTRFRSYNLFQELIPDTRTCLSSGIPLFWCSCLPFRDSPNLLSSSLIKSLTSEVLFQLNSLNLKPQSTLGSICQPLSLNSILSVKTQETEGEKYFNLKFKVNESVSAIFEALVLISKSKIRKREKDGFGSSAFWTDSKTYMKIMYVKRLDAYAGICQEVCKEVALDPMFCICEDFQRLKASHKQLMKQVYNKREILVTDLSCEQACNRLEMGCDEFAYVLYSSCSAFNTNFCKTCAKSRAGYSYQERGQCFLDFSMFSCTAVRKSAICFCKKVDNNYG
jgi:hypothetical protein